MTVTLSVLVNVIGYMVNPAIGFSTTLATVLFVVIRSGKRPLEKLLTLLVITMPLYGLPIFNGIHHIFSWTSLFLVAIILYSGAHIHRVSPVLFVMMLPIVSFTVATHVLNGGGAEGAYFVAQILLFVLPVAVVYSSRTWVVTAIDRDTTLRLLHAISGTVMACGFGVFVQAIIHRSTGVVVGSVSSFADRFSYDLTVNAYSVLSVILAVGLVLGPILVRRGYWAQGLTLAVVSGGAILVNTSRSGLLVGSAVLLISLAVPVRGVSRILPRLAIIPGAIFAYWMFSLYSESNRGVADFLDDNGRFKTFEDALAAIGTDPASLLMGKGYNPTAYVGTLPHNFLLETLLSSGMIVLIAVLVLIIGLWRFLAQSEWKYPFYIFLAGGMLFAGFYAVKAAVIVTILMIVFRAADGAIPGDFKDKKLRDFSRKHSGMSLPIG